MKARFLLFTLMAAFFMLSRAKAILAEDVMKGGSVPESEAAGIQWVWGDVVNVDKQNKTLLVKYFDYETDQDKELSVIIDDQTTFENIQTLDEANVGDVVSIDYSVDATGKNVAKNISVEKPEAMPEIEESAAPALEEEAQDIQKEVTPAQQE